MTVNVNIETKNIIKVFTLAAMFTIGVFALAKMYDAIIMVLVAFFIALALNPPISFLSKYMPSKRRGPSVAIVLVAVFALFSFLLASIIPPVVRETSNFIDAFPETVNSAFRDNEKVQKYVEKYKLQDDIDSAVQTGRQKIRSFNKQLVSDLGSIGNSFLTTISVLVIAILMLTNGPKLLAKFSDVVYRDPKTRKRHEKVAAGMYQAVTGYVIGQVSVATVASLFALGAMVLLHVPYPLPLASIVFTLGLIPLIGNTLAAIIVVLSTFVLKDLTSGLILLGFFLVYQQIENMTLQPIVQGKTTNLPSLVVFVSVILGVALIGPIGGLFAIPVVGCLRVLLIDYLDHRSSAVQTNSPQGFVQKVKHHVAKSVS